MRRGYVAVDMLKFVPSSSIFLQEPILNQYNTRENKIKLVICILNKIQPVTAKLKTAVVRLMSRVQGRTKALARQLKMI